MSRRRRALRLLAALLTLALVLPGTTAGRTPDGGRGAAWIRDGRPVARAVHEVAPRLLVKYRPGTSGPERAAIRAAGGLSLARTTGSGTEILRPTDRSLAQSVAHLRRQPDVARVTIDHHRRLFGDPQGEPAWAWQWGHHNTGQNVNGYLGVADADTDGLQALRQTEGSASVVVAVIDDGVDFGHPELASRAWVNPGESGPDGLGGDKSTNGLDDDGNELVDDVHGWDFCNDDNTVHDFDEDWHGTGVAGTIAASIDGQGTAGVAPATKIMALKFLRNLENEPDPQNPVCGWDSQAIAAIDYAASFGVPIINASWGGDEGEPALEAAIERSGALFVAAAGNDGRNIDLQPSYPAAFDSPNIVSVGAIYNDGLVTEFSNFGKVGVDLVAPGGDVVAPCPADAIDPQPGTCWLNGTSFSAPYVSGVAALAGASQPALLASPTALRSRVLTTGTPIASAAGITATGRLANAHAVVDVAAPVLTGAPTVLPVVGTQLGAGSGSIRTRIAWSAAVDNGDEVSYGVERRRNLGAWGSVGAGLGGRQADMTIGFNSRNDFRVRPTDGGGNIGAWSSVTTFTPLLYQETTSLARRTGTWRSSSSSYSSGGRTLYTTSSGASATFTFTGRAAAFVAPRGPTRSSFKVYLDGKYVGTVSLHKAASQSRQVLFSTGWLKSGKHTLKLVSARVGSRTRAELDAFVVYR